MAGMNEVFMPMGESAWLINNQLFVPAKHEKLPRQKLKVKMCCSKCEEKAREEIREVEGVLDVITDMEESKVTVIGRADPLSVLKKARKVHRKAQFWTEKPAKKHTKDAHDSSQNWHTHYVPGEYRPSQSYPAHYYPDSSSSSSTSFNFITNPNYLKHIKY